MHATTILGANGAVGSAIHRTAVKLSGENATVCVPRGQQVNPTGKGPVWVCTTNDALKLVLHPDVLPPHRRQDVILLQNGHLQQLAASYGLALPGDLSAVPCQATPATQVLLYAAALPGGRFKCGGRTVVSGPLAEHCVELLTTAGVQCRVLPGPQLAAAAVEKLIWASIAWLMCSALGGITVGQLVTEHKHDFTDLALEMLRLAAGDPRQQSQHVRVLLGQEERVLDGLIGYSLDIGSAVPSRAMALAEFEWRNAYFLGCLAKATPDDDDGSSGTGCLKVAQQVPSSQPTLHEQWLYRAGMCDMINKYKTV